MTVMRCIVVIDIEIFMFIMSIIMVHAMDIMHWVMVITMVLWMVIVISFNIMVFNSEMGLPFNNLP